MIRSLRVNNAFLAEVGMFFPKWTVLQREASKVFSLLRVSPSSSTSPTVLCYNTRPLSKVAADFELLAFLNYN